MNSDNTKTPRNLQNAAAAKRFLLELANMGDRPNDAGRFWRKCSEFFPQDAFRVSEEVEAVLPSDRKWQPGQPGWTTSQELSSERKSNLLQQNLLQLRDWLREAW